MPKSQKKSLTSIEIILDTILIVINSTVNAISKKEDVQKCVYSNFKFEKGDSRRLFYVSNNMYLYEMFDGSYVLIGSYVYSVIILI